MVQTPGDIKSKENKAGGEVLSIQATLQLITSTGVGTFPMFVVPTGEAYRVTAMRVVCISAIGGTGTETAIAKLTAHATPADITTDATGTFTKGTEAIASAKTPAIVVTADVDKLTAAETLNIVTSGTTTGTFLHVRVDLVRVSNNM